MYKKKQIITIIFQGLLKLKTKIKLKNINLDDLLFLDFLWLNNITYGYLNCSYVNLKKIVLFLKYNKSTAFSPLLFISKNIKYKSLKRETKWAKNTFFILYTKSGFLNTTEIKQQKIGGYLFGKFF